MIFAGSKMVRLPGCRRRSAGVAVAVILGMSAMAVVFPPVASAVVPASPVNAINTHQRSIKPRAPLPESARMQVAWTMVRSKVTSFGATSRNENYREVWHLWRKADGSLILISPRAKVQVQQASPDQSILTNEGDLATLLGLLPRTSPVSKAQTNLVASAMARPLAIDLQDPRIPVQAQFSFGDEESYAINFEIMSLKAE